MLEGLIELPFSTDPILETEEHVLTECPKYHQLRSNLSDNLKSLILLKAYGTIMSSSHIYEFGKYLTDCHRLRNPAKTPPEPLWCYPFIIATPTLAPTPSPTTPLISTTTPTPTPTSTPTFTPHNSTTPTPLLLEPAPNKLRLNALCDLRTRTLPILNPY